MKEYHRAMDSYKAGLQYEPDNALCQQGLVKVQQAIASANYGGEVDQERARHAMADPEVRSLPI
jgi:stress-induced-phosphoprotein 1